jgi:hypothetical protein
VRISKYSGEKSTQTSDVPAPVYLAISKNVELLQNIQDRQVTLTSCFTILRGKREKVKLSLCLINSALSHEGVCGSGCIDPNFLDLGPCRFTHG